MKEPPGMDELSRLLDEIGQMQRQLEALQSQVNRLREQARPSGREPEEPKQPPSVPAMVAPVAQGPEFEAPMPARPEAPIATEQPASEVTQPAKEKLSLEQRLGVSWLNKIGVVVLILAAVFFFQYAVQQGWIREPVRVAIVALGGLLLLAAGEWTYRRAMRIFSAGVTGGGIALLYASAYAASPNFYELLSTPVSFTLMCVVTVLGIFLSLRQRMMSTAILAQVGAYLTPYLLKTGHDEQVILMIYLMALAAGFLSLAAVRRWKALVWITLAGTFVLFCGWFAEFYTAQAAVRTSGFAWALFGLFAAYAGLATAAEREDSSAGIGLVAVGSAALVFLHVLQRADLSTGGILAQWLVLAVVALGLSLWRKWQELRAAAMVWTVIGMWVLYGLVGSETSVWLWCGWAWVFYGLFLADILLRTFLLRRDAAEKSDATAGAVLTAAMFGATYYLLRVEYKDWMGLYTALLAMGTFGLAWLFRSRAGKRTLARTYFGQGLALVALAIPIQFDKATVTIAWGIQAVVAITLAQRFRSKMLAVKSVAVLGLAVLHFGAVDLAKDERVAQVIFSIGRTELTWGLIMAVSLTAAAMYSAWRLADGNAIFSEADDRFTACGLVWLGAGLWAWRTVAELPAVAASWWWLALAGGVAAAGLWPKRLWLAGSGGIMLAAVAGKFLAYDTLGRRLAEAVEPKRMVMLNWQFLAGLALAVIILLYTRKLWPLIARRPQGGAVRTAAVLLAALVVLWAGSFEIDRYFTGTRAERLAHVELAEQMAYSIWWGVYAAGLLAIGFFFRFGPVRYMSLAIFAVTLGKVFILDMAGVEAGYRIASFVALGGLLVVASLLYQRYFKSALEDWSEELRR